MERRSVRTTLMTLVLTGLAVVLMGCPPEVIKIGAVLPLTGDGAAYGQAVRKGMELALDEIKADGLALEIEVVDTQSDPDNANKLLKEQYSNGAMAAIGGVTSGEAKQMIEVVDRYDRILLSPTASSPDLTGISRNFYRIFPSDHTAASKMAQAAAQGLSIKKIVIIAEEQPYARGIQSVFAPAFEGLDGEILETIEFPPHTTDMAALVSRAISLEPDGIYLAGYADGIGATITELRKQNYQGKILTTSAFATSTAIAQVGDAAAGVFLTQTVFETDSDHAHIRTFVNGYREKYGEQPDIYAAHGYDAMKVMAAAIKGRPALPGEVKKGLRDAIKDFPGVTGSIQFDDLGDVRKFPRLYIIDKIDTDLLMVDYNDRVRRKQDEIKKRREALKRQLEQIQKKASDISG